jgi:hypothetical protein
MEKNKIIYTKNTMDYTDIVLIMGELSRWLYGREFIRHSYGGTMSLKKFNISWDDNYSKDEQHYIILTKLQNKKINLTQTIGGIPYSRYFNRFINDARNNGINLIVPIVDNISDSESDSEESSCVEKETLE